VKPLCGAAALIVLGLSGLESVSISSSIWGEVMLNPNVVPPVAGSALSELSINQTDILPICFIQRDIYH